MITTQFFNARMTAENMKAEYKKLVKIYHPDLHPGIDDITIKTINNEFSYWYARAASEEVYTRKTDEQPDKDYSKYRNSEYISNLEAMINWLLANNLDRFTGVEIDLVGVFIWISGITYDQAEARAIVKGVGFQGSYKHHDDGSKEYMWKWTPEIRRFAANPNIDSIKRTYGSYNQNRKGSTRKQLA
jgi:hypothetical protein